MMIGLDLFNELAHRLRWPRVTTLEGTLQPEHEKLLTLINRVLETMPTIDDWPMLQADGFITLVASEQSDLTVGLEQYVTATQDSFDVTVDNMTFDASYQGRAFQVAGDEYPYRIGQVISPTEIRLTRAWISESIVPADQRVFTIAMDRYALASDFDRPLDDFNNLFGGTIRAISPEEFRALRRKNTTITLGDPAVFTIYGLTDNETSMVLHFHPYPSDKRMLTYPYLRVHPRVETDEDKILFPKRHIEALMEVILYLAKRDHEDEVQLDLMLRDKMSELNTALANSTVTGDRHVLVPSQHMRRRIYNRYGRQGYRIDWGSSFDLVGNYDFPE